MKNTLSFAFIKILSFLPLELARKLGVAAGVWLWIVNSRSKKTTLKNLEICFPDLDTNEREIIAKKSLCETAKTFFEACIIWRRDWLWLKSKIIEVSGEDILLEKFNKGKGVVVITVHLGNWEVVGPYVANKIPLTALYQPLKESIINNWVLIARNKKNMDMAPSSTQGVRKLLKALRQNQGVCILPDQVPDRNTGRELAPFFNKPAWTMTLVHNLASRTGCEICYCYSERIKNGFRVSIVDANPNIFSEDLQVSIGAMNADLEKLVNQSVIQYQWEYKRFRQLPSEHWVAYK